VGAVIGGVAGGLAGKAVGEQIDPTVEELYWRSNFHLRSYVRPNTPYERYATAYRYGIENSMRLQGRGYEDVEPELQSGWGTLSDDLVWDEASPAIRDAYERANRNCPKRG
jgi:hypothetical protein